VLFKTSQCAIFRAVDSALPGRPAVVVKETQLCAELDEDDGPRARLRADDALTEAEVFDILAKHGTSPQLVARLDVVRTSEALALVLEPADADLFTFIASHGALEEKHALDVFARIVAGVARLHALRIAHLDLKPENILINVQGGEPPPCNPPAAAAHQSAAGGLQGGAPPPAITRLMVGDFGLSRRLPEGETAAGWRVRRTGRAGTGCTMSPEAYERVLYNPFQADVYALGIMLFALLTGVYPYALPSRDTDRSFRYLMPTADSAPRVAELLKLQRPKLALSARTLELLGGMLHPPARRWALAQVQAALERVQALEPTGGT
jgi:serine/threonine protein kinase